MENTQITPINLCVFKTVLETVDNGVLFINLDGFIKLINKPAKQILQPNLPLHRFNIAGHTLSDRCILSSQVEILDFTHIKFWQLFVDDLLGFSMREALQLCFCPKLLYRTIRSKELEIKTSFVFEGSRDQHGLYIQLTDITNKQQQQNLAVRNELLIKLGELIYSITHEIKNPLGAIRGFASLLFKDLAEQKHLQEMTLTIIEATKSLERIVSGVLQYAKPLKLQTQSTEIGQFFRNCIRFIKTDPSSPANIQWHVHIPDIPIIAPIDSLALQSAIQNLIINAFQAMPNGGVLTLTLLKSNQNFLITISDTGFGMDEESTQKLFTPYFTTKENGNGLGLVEVQKIIKAHMGSIEVRSTISKGTTFTITLPIQRL